MRTSTPHLVFTLAILLAINTMNFFDRQILPAVQEKIRKEWDLSDSALGGLGTAFAWNFSSLFVLRMGVGVGEASCAPAANSLIGDLVPARQRARALAIF